MHILFMKSLSGMYVTGLLTVTLAGQVAPVAAQRATHPLEASLRNAVLAAQNRVRAEVQVPPLTWSDDLARYARHWAESLTARHAFAHRPHTQYGENLFERRGGHAAPEQVVAAWASEAQNYDLRTNTCHGVCRHYTQLVWRSTERVGCDVAQSEGAEIWVCNYDPPGNIIGQRPY